MHRLQAGRAFSLDFGFMPTSPAPLRGRTGSAQPCPMPLQAPPTDLVVVGASFAGVACALAAARYGLVACIVAAIFVAALMIGFYRLLGIIAAIALIINMVMLAALMGVESQLQSHVRISMNVGLSAQQLRQLGSVLADRVDAESAKRVRDALERHLASKPAG